MAKKAGKSRGRFVVRVENCMEGNGLVRYLDGGVGGMKDRRAAARVAFYWLTDNGYAQRPVATKVAAKLEDGETADYGRFRLTIEEGA